ncbi:thiol-disulfide oxidoreductase DCC (macronuclear) [Tetrahymena thermophila SB210]|uniref:Thiol-disulfide oxidoreductase DCC n=1 Tax=Tetrahymena thermophila (strain SB210) TaxID=312017 RepID=W7X6M1_TETTS|nr:thiol-disulfide oxidoreductase DCC [Tetrahymena thermophila SB210]EWS72023.1 thiol-disulfide oxidoreductase DCC [Tetrahymena thermophila SB210]|eukprot:XP_012655430.1 thiol-disulfide oxidoreductase DCC [Tetrahymena thermophila SB210]
MNEYSVEDFEKYLQNGKIIFLYDGLCNLCYGTVKFFYNRNPSKFEFINLQSVINNNQLVEIFQIPTSLNAVTIIKGAFNSTQNNQNQLQKPYRILYKSQAIQECLKELKQPWCIIGFIIQLIPLTVKDFSYDLIGRFRYKIFGKSDQICQIQRKQK